MTKEENEKYCYLFSFLSLLISISVLLFSSIYIFEYKEQIKILQEQNTNIVKDIDKEKDNISSFKNDCINIIDKNTLYVETIVDKVVNNKW